MKRLYSFFALFIAIVAATPLWAGEEITFTWAAGTATKSFSIAATNEKTFSIDWGDGTANTYTGSGQFPIAHTYSNASTYNVTIRTIDDDCFFSTFNSSSSNISTLDVSKAPSLIALHCNNNQLKTLDLSKNIHLEILDCSQNQLEILDLSKNINLEILRCSQNLLKTLDLQKNTKLISVHCYQNQLKTLDLSKNIHLETLYCYQNQLKTLDVSKIISLQILRCYQNQLETLDLSKNTSLRNLQCSENPIRILDLSQNTYLLVLGCYQNQLETLDLSTHTYLIALDCDGNQLKTLDLSKNKALNVLYCGNNQLKTLDLSKNKALSVLYCDDNQLKTLDLSENTTLSSLYCRYNLLTTLDLSKNIALTHLECPNNRLSAIELPNPSKLVRFSGTNNALPLTLIYSISKQIADWGDSPIGSSQILPTQKVALNASLPIDTVFHGLNTTFTVRKTGGTTATENVDYTLNNGYIAFTTAGVYSVVVSNPALALSTTVNSRATFTYSFIVDTAMEKQEIKFTGNGATVQLIASTNKEYTIDWGDGTANTYTGSGSFEEYSHDYANTSTNYTATITGSDAGCLFSDLAFIGEEIVSIDVTKAAALQSLRISGTNITGLDVSKNSMLYDLTCTYNKRLTQLGLSANALLQSVECSYNNLNSVDVSSNSNFANFRCHDNAIPLANLYAISSKGGFKSGFDVFFGSQNLPKATVAANTPIDLSPSWLLGGTYTVFSIKSSNPLFDDNEDYLFSNGILLFKYPGTYTVTMTNKAIRQAFNAEVIATYEVQGISSDARLSNLTVSTGTLTPVFKPSTTTYLVNVPYSTTSVTITATANHSAATVTGDGTKVLAEGTNPFDIKVTAEDGTERTYTIILNRIKSNDATLKNLTVSAGTLTPAFNANTTNYAVSVSSDITSIVLTATKNHPAATVTGDGEKNELAFGVNTFTITVTAEDGTTKKDYKVSVNRIKSNDATLKNLIVNPGTLTPVFNANTINYTVNVTSDITSIELIATKNHPAATVTGAGTKSGLAFGENKFPITVTAEDGTVKSYTVTVNRIRSNDATLKNLTVSPGTLTPVFNANTFYYTVSVISDITSIVITATKNHAGATVTGDGVKEGLAFGNNQFDITVTAEDGTTKKIYTVTVNRIKSSDATLSNLTVNVGTLSPAFDANTTFYTVDVPNNVTSITLTATKNHSGATVTGDGVKNGLATGANRFLITVTAENLSVNKVYEVVVNRAKSNDNTLSSLSVYPHTLSPAFSPNTTYYTVNLPYKETSIIITATKNHSAATITGDGVKNNLAVGSSLFAVAVTAENGTVKVYNITVIRAKSSDALLDKLVLNSSGTLSPNFDPATMHYTLKLPCGANAVSLSTAAFANGSLHYLINNSPVSMPLAISDPGTTNLTIRIASDDKTATRDYMVAIVRPFDKSIIRQYWNDVLAVNLNTEANGGHTFTGFQWYKNGQIINGAREAYLYLNGGIMLEGDYYSVDLTTKNGTTPSCDVKMQTSQKPTTHLTAYPNPTKGALTIEKSPPTPEEGLKAQLFDLTGRLVMTLTLAGDITTINIGHLQEGTYLLKVGQETITVIKQ